MLKKLALGVSLAAIALTSVSANAEVSLKIQEEGFAGELKLDQKGPDNFVLSLGTVRESGNYATCELDDHQCTLYDNDILVCDLIEGETVPVVAKLYVNGIKVIAGDHDAWCGMGGSYLGLYK